jgi:hypothetical protein
LKLSSFRDLTQWWRAKGLFFSKIASKSSLAYFVLDCKASFKREFALVNLSDTLRGLRAGKVRIQKLSLIPPLLTQTHKKVSFYFWISFFNSIVAFWLGKHTGKISKKKKILPVTIFDKTYFFTSVKLV